MEELSDFFCFRFVNYDEVKDVFEKFNICKVIGYDGM